MNQNVLLNQIMRNSQITNNPMANNAYQLMQKNDIKGLEEMASNLCKEKNIDVMQLKEQVKQRFGL